MQVSDYVHGEEIVGWIGAENSTAVMASICLEVPFSIQLSSGEDVVQ